MSVMTSKERARLDERMNPIASDLKLGQRLQRLDTNGRLVGVVSDGAANASVAVTEIGDVVRQTTLTLSALSVLMPTVNTNNAAGGALLYTFPEGLVNIVGCVLNLALTTDLAASATVAAGVGTAISSNDGDLGDAGEATILGSTALTFSSSAAAYVDISATDKSEQILIDGTTTAGKVYLNFADADNVGGAAKFIKSTGTIKITWIHLGDK